MAPENNHDVGSGDSTHSTGTAPVINDDSPSPAPTDDQIQSHPSTSPEPVTPPTDSISSASHEDVSISPQPETEPKPIETSPAIAQESTPPTFGGGMTDMTTPDPQPQPDTPTSYSPSPPPDSPPEVSHEAPAAVSTAKKLPTKIMLAAFVAVLLLGAVAGFSYQTGKNNVPKPVVEAPKPINLPKEATLVSECTPGRGKQYIEPKDIRAGGPMYDVKNDKVIAIEYTLGLQALATNSDQFSSTILKLTKNYPVDHLSVVPEPPKPGDTDQYLHLIMFVVSKAEANSITCAGVTQPGAGATTPTTVNPTAR